MLFKHIRQRSAGRPKVAHAVVVIFMEFFAWGLLTTPMLTVLHKTFPQHTFLMNGLIQGVKGFLSFMSAPLIGALSDVWGRKSFLLLTVFFTCAPIPLMRLSPWCFFALMSVSGLFAVTFSVIFAYVADITEEHERSTAYGLVSATFAASLVTSPAIGAFLSLRYGDSLVVLLATIIAVADILFVLLVVPESLPDKMRLSSWGLPISWEQADPFASLRKVGNGLHSAADLCHRLPVVSPRGRTVFQLLPLFGTVQISKHPYIKIQLLETQNVINFSSEAIAGFIAMVGILSIGAQTLLLSVLMKKIGNKSTVLLGLGFQLFQLAWYGFGSEPWVTYTRCGAVQGMITGIRGLCNGLGPALFGFIFFLFNVELKELSPVEPNPVTPDTEEKRVIPGPPFLFGACTVLLALLVAVFIPAQHAPAVKTCSTHVMMESASGVTENGSVPVSDEDNEPLLQDSSL
ncbi:hypothetical protein cypCar_00028789 [Cyprinus carpio]|nr:hypothetical protein cypCar_00028789 [Cyprinus carpio]